jgi:hypothetical protein
LVALHKRQRGGITVKSRKSERIDRFAFTQFRTQNRYAFLLELLYGDWRLSLSPNR